MFIFVITPINVHKHLIRFVELQSYILTSTSYDFLKMYRLWRLARDIFLRLFLTHQNESQIVLSWVCQPSQCRVSARLSGVTFLSELGRWPAGLHRKIYLKLKLGHANNNCGISLETRNNQDYLSNPIK